MPTPVPTPIILDCDPGHDDAVAILLAAADPRLELLAITTVAGNQTLDKCTLNARRVCTLGGIDRVPIAAGADRPLTRPPRVAADIHGTSGLDGVDWPEPTVDVVDQSAVELMAELLSGRTEPVTLVPTGPLTNVATLLSTHPELVDRIGRIVLMGGSTGRGNATPYAEFNILVDPEAANLVFESGVPITMIGLNVTHQALVTEAVQRRLTAIGGPVAEACVALMMFYADRYEQRHGMPSPPLHDPVAVAAVIDPDVVRTVSAPVVVETTGTHTAGATVVDLHHVTGRPDSAEVAVDLEVRTFFDLVVGAVESYR